MWGGMNGIRAALHCTIIRVNDGGHWGNTRVKVSHEWSNVLSGCQHPMDHVSCVEKTCGYWKILHDILLKIHLYSTLI